MRETQQEYTIGKLSESTGVHIETIRYYEKIGLLPAPPRSEGGHRLYRTEHYARLILLRRSRELGFSLEEIRTLLRLVEEGTYTCEEIKMITMHHLRNVRQKIKDLRTLEKALVAVASQCDGGSTQECPIIENLFMTYS